MVTYCVRSAERVNATSIRNGRSGGLSKSMARAQKALGQEDIEEHLLEIQKMKCVSASHPIGTRRATAASFF